MDVILRLSGRGLEFGGGEGVGKGFLELVGRGRRA